MFSNANLRSWNERGIGRAQRGTVFQKPTGSTYLWEQEHWLDGRRVILRIVCSIVEILGDVPLFCPERGLHKLELQRNRKNRTNGHLYYCLFLIIVASSYFMFFSRTICWGKCAQRTATPATGPFFFSLSSD